MTRAHLLGSSSLVAALALTRVAFAAPSDTAPASAAPATAAPATAAPATTAPATAAPPPPSTPTPAAAPTPAATPAPVDQPSSTPPRQPAPESRSSLELSLAIGPTVTAGDAANAELDPSVTRVGLFGDFGVAYRSRYFLTPYVSVGYGSLATGEVHLPSGDWGAGGTLSQHLGAWTISPGLMTQIWRFRPRIGIGLAVVNQSYEFAGQSNSSTQLPLVTELGLGFLAWDSPRFRIDVEARAVLIPGADVRFGTLLLNFRADAVYFGSKK